MDHELTTLNINLHNIYYICNLSLVYKIQPMQVTRAALSILLAVLGYIVNCHGNI